MNGINGDSSSTATLLLSPIGFAMIGSFGVLLPSLAGAAWTVRRQRRRARLWNAVAQQMNMTGVLPLPGQQGLSGVCRGRSVKARLIGGDLLHVSARVHNPSRLFDTLSCTDTGSALPGAAWLDDVARAELTALTFSPRSDAARRSSSARRERPSWQVRVRYRTVTLVCTGVEATTDRMRFLIGLACDVAESVDRFGAE